MAEMLRLEMVTPYKQVLAVDVDEVTAPGTLGEFGILPGHTPLLTTLKIGQLTYRQGSELFHVAVNWGYVEVENDKVTVLVETAEPADQIDLARAKEALSRAEAGDQDHVAGGCRVCPDGGLPRTRPHPHPGGGADVPARPLNLTTDTLVIKKAILAGRLFCVVFFVCVHLFRLT